jgi:UDP-glucose 4-epimerase
MAMAIKALVTGGAGFIGSHLVDRLLADGCSVVVLDNFSTGRPQNLAHVAADQPLTLIEADITDYDTIAPHFKDVDWVFHLAALADIVPSIERPTDYFNANVIGTQRVLEAARNANVKRFVYAASSSCYGIPDATPTPESAEMRPQYPYALTKRLGEELALHWGQVYSMPVVSTRFFNVYGPRSRTSGTYGAVFGVFLAQKLNKKPFTVVGDGTQTRDFTYVTDIADALVKSAGSSISDTVFNVGSGNTYSVNRLVELLGGPVVHIPKRPGEPDCTFADISAIKKELTWKPRVSFEDGVKLILQHIDYWKQAPVWTPQSIEKATAKWFQNLDTKAPIPTKVES